MSSDWSLGHAVFLERKWPHWRLQVHGLNCVALTGPLAMPFSIRKGGLTSTYRVHGEEVPHGIHLMHHSHCVNEAS